MTHAGSVFAILVFVHFAVDWLCQTNYEATHKAVNHKIRAKHCLVYAIGFLPVLLVAQGIALWEAAACFVWLWLSHFCEDTYLPVYWWAKYVRKPHGVVNLSTFIAWAKTPIGLILVITVDQIIHIACLWPVVWLWVRS